MIVEKNEKKMHKLTEPKVLEILIASLKALHKQQESKRKNYKRLINSFSVRVQKYEDSSSNADTANEFKKKKTEIVAEKVTFLAQAPSNKEESKKNKS